MAIKKVAPKKRTTTTTVEETATAAVAEADELDVFERARVEFSGGPSGVKLTIYRYDDGDTSYLKRVDYDPDTIDEEWIRKKWGAGSYQLRFIDSEEPGAPRWSKVISIAADMTPSLQPSASQGGLGETVLITMLQRQNEIMLQGLVGMVGKGGGAPAPAGNDAMTKIVEGLQAQTNAMLQAALNKPDASASLLTMLEKGMQIAADSKLDAEGGWFGQIARAAREILPALAEMRANMPMPPMPPPPGTPIAATPALPAPAAKVNGGDSPSHAFVSTAPASPPASPTPPLSATPGGPGGGGIVDDALRQFAPQIVAAIEQGATPASVADAILGSIPPMYYDAFDNLQPERLIQAEPRLAQHRQFVADVLENLKDEDDKNPEPSTTA